MILIQDLVLVLGIALLGAYLTKKAKLPLLVGYILAGIVTGAVLGQTKISLKIADLSEIGIIFLMFVLGIEFSFRRLTRVRKVVVLGGIGQIILTVFFGFFFFNFLKFGQFESFFLACLFSLSSTAIVAKILSEKGIDLLSGEITIGWLLIQDLAVLPMAALLPILGRTATNPVSLFGAILKSGFLLVLTVFLGKQIIPKLLSKAASFAGREFFLIFTVFLALLFALITSLLGFSLALGAFLAGLIISESTKNHMVFSQTRVLRDLFSPVFFVSLGMLFSFQFFMSNLITLVGISAILMLFKFILTMLLVLYFGFHPKTAFLVGINLTQAGEFAFVLAKMGLTDKIISFEIYQTVVAVAILTMLVTPYLLNISPKLYTLLRRTSEKYPFLSPIFFRKFQRKISGELSLENHVIICGYGRVGRHIGSALRMTGIPFAVIDFNYQVISALKDQGIGVVYGDPADFEVLKSGGIEKARVLVIALADRFSQEAIIQNGVRLNKNISIICRSHFPEDRERLFALGSDFIIQPEFEAGLSIIHRIFDILNVEKTKTAEIIKKIKREPGIGR